MHVKHLIIPAVITGVIGAVTFIAVDELRKKATSSLTEGPAYRVTGPLVSVVIPALEEENYLANLLTSVQSQSYRPLETIIVDSSPFSSAERIQEICEEYGAKYVHVPKLGVSFARNQGAKEAKGQILVFSDADNILAPDCIEKLVDVLGEDYLVASPIETVYDSNFMAFAAIWGRNFFKGTRTTRCVAVWHWAFDQVHYDEACDPMEGCREDIKLGQDIINRFGEGSIKLARDALVGSSARREKKQGIKMWKSRGVRDSQVLPY